MNEKHETNHFLNFMFCKNAIMESIKNDDIFDGTVVKLVEKKGSDFLFFFTLIYLMHNLEETRR